jgi:hypothetical protein
MQHRYNSDTCSYIQFDIYNQHEPITYNQHDKTQL